MRIALYIGMYRFPTEPQDIGVELLDAMCSNQVCKPTLLIARADDAVITIAKEKYNLEVLLLPETFDLGQSTMKSIFSQPSLPEPIEGWLQNLRRYKIDLGLAYCSSWIPPQLNNSIKNGFVNIHPGPLPHFTGYDPEKFLILNHATEGWGTFHLLSEAFDEGLILMTGNKVCLHEDITTPELSQRISRGCFDLLPQFFTKFEAGQLRPVPQNNAERRYATRKLGYQNSLIDWQNDNNNKIYAKMRAFNSMADHMPVKAIINHRIHVINHLELTSGDFAGIPGEIIGTYNCSPIVRTIDGSCLLTLGVPVTESSTPVLLDKKFLITSKNTIKKHHPVWLSGLNK